MFLEFSMPLLLAHWQFFAATNTTSTLLSFVIFHTSYCFCSCDCMLPRSICLLMPKSYSSVGQVYLLKFLPLRLYATSLAFNSLAWDTCLDWANVSSDLKLHQFCFPVFLSCYLVTYGKIWYLSYGRPRLAAYIVTYLGGQMRVLILW